MNGCWLSLASALAYIVAQHNSHEVSKRDMTFGERCIMREWFEKSIGFLRNWRWHDNTIFWVFIAGLNGLRNLMVLMTWPVRALNAMNEQLRYMICHDGSNRKYPCRSLLSTTLQVEVPPFGLRYPWSSFSQSPKMWKQTCDMHVYSKSMKDCASERKWYQPAPYALIIITKSLIQL